MLKVSAFYLEKQKSFVYWPNFQWRFCEKEEAKKKEESDKYWAKIEDDMETKKREENTISEKEPYMVSTMVVENEKWNWFDFIYY